MIYNSLKEFVLSFSNTSNYRISLYDVDGFLMFSNYENSVCKDDNILDNLDKILRDEEYSLGRYCIYSCINVDQKLFCILKVESLSVDIVFFTSIIKSSIETRIQITQQANTEKKKFSLNEMLFEKLISYEEDKDVEVTYNLAKACHFSLNEKRAVIFIHSDVVDFSYNNISFFTTDHHEKENKDFVHVVDKHTLVVFKQINENLVNNITDFKEDVRKYISIISRYYNTEINSFISSIQEDFSDIKTGYHQCEWLVKKYYNPDSKTPCFFYDNVTDYLFDGISFSKLDLVFDGITNIIKNERSVTLEQAISISDALIANDFIVSDAAATLFMHKNTLLYKINKIKKLMGIEKTNAHQVHILISLWNYYIKIKEGV